MASWVTEARKAAARYNVDPDVFVAQIRQESGGKQGLVSSAGARDIAQFMPPTAKQYGVTLGDGRISDDLDGAARLMRDALKRTGGNYRAALSIYNSGRPDGYKRFDETREYVRKILGASGGAPAHNPSSELASTPRLRTTTTGPSEAEQRNAILGDYLSQRGKPGALIGLGVGLSNIKAPETTTTRLPSSTPKTSGRSPTTGELIELYWQGADGVNVKHNQPQPQGFVSGHKDHVHLAADPRDILRWAKVAQQMGLRVGENPAFGGVAPVHVKNSNHYAVATVGGRKVGKAIDVSGDAAKMREFAHRVARSYGVG